MLTQSCQAAKKNFFPTGFDPRVIIFTKSTSRYLVTVIAATALVVLICAEHHEDECATAVWKMFSALQGLPTLRQAQGSQPGAGRACRSRSGFPHLSQPSASSGFAARRGLSLSKPERVSTPVPPFGRLRVRYIIPATRSRPAHSAHAPARRSSARPDGPAAPAAHSVAGQPAG